MTKSRVRLGGDCVFALLLLTGCGDDNPLGRRAIDGTVTLNGQPLDAGAVFFEPENPTTGMAAGSNITAGKYSVPAEHGLPPGKYIVRITSGHPTETIVEEMPGEAPKSVAKERVPPEWNLKSQHQIEVKSEGDAVFDFDIK